MPHILYLLGVNVLVVFILNTPSFLLPPSLSLPLLILLYITNLFSLLLSLNPVSFSFSLSLTLSSSQYLSCILSPSFSISLSHSQFHALSLSRSLSFTRARELELTRLSSPSFRSHALFRPDAFLCALFRRASRRAFRPHGLFRRHSRTTRRHSRDFRPTNARDSWRRHCVGVVSTFCRHCVGVTSAVLPAF